jgi:hypothetical protein
MKPIPWYIDTLVSWMPLPYELQCKIFKWNRTVAFKNRFQRLEKILLLEPMQLFYVPFEYLNNHYYQKKILRGRGEWDDPLFKFTYFHMCNKRYFYHRWCSMELV